MVGPKADLDPMAWERGGLLVVLAAYAGATFRRSPFPKALAKNHPTGNNDVRRPKDSAHDRHARRERVHDRSSVAMLGSMPATSSVGLR